MKPGYKQSEVGVIPEEWEVRKIDSLCGTITTGKLDANAMRPDGPYRFYTCAKDFYQIDKFAFDCEALLISGNGAHVGYIHYYQGKFNAYQRTYVLFGFRDDIKFIEHYLSDNFKKRIEVEVKAGGTPYITRPTIAETALPIPPLPEQRAIAEALSDVDGLLGGLDRLIAKKRDLKQAAMQQLLTGQTRLPGFHGEWKFHILGNIGRFKNGLNKDSSAFGHGFAFVNLMDVFGVNSISATTHLGLVDSTKLDREVYDLRRGDVLFIRSSVKPSGVGLSALVEADLKDAVYSGFMIRFRDEGVLDLGFKKHCFYEENFRRKVIAASSVSANTNINQNALKQLTLPLPPTKEEQTAIAQILSDMDAQLTALEQRREKTLSLKQAMMQELLTGRTRLV
jgi:type I restriction enzyme S subunit